MKSCKSRGLESINSAPANFHRINMSQKRLILSEAEECPVFAIEKSCQDFVLTKRFHNPRSDTAYTMGGCIPPFKIEIHTMS